LKKLIVIRNKIVAHDEQLFGSAHAFVGRRADLSAEGVLTAVSIPTFFAMGESEGFEDLVKTAVDWIEKQSNHLREKIVKEFNALPPGQRAAFERVEIGFVERPLPA
jgi:hypothetical protein